MEDRNLMGRKKPPGHAAKLKKYGIYFDESAREEAVKDATTNGWNKTGQFAYVFTAATVNQRNKTSLENQLFDLRQEMTCEVLKVAPHLENHKSLRDGHPLEIHAVDLYQSGGIYREIKRIDDRFWHRQHDWLEKALQIGSHPGVRYHFNTSSTEQNAASWGSVPRLDDSLLKYLPFEKVKNKIKSMQANPYFTSFPILLSLIDDYLIEKGGRGDLYCHTNFDAKGYSTLASFAHVRARGHYARIKPPEFKTCTQEPLIQLADTAGYVLLQFHYSGLFNQPMNARVQRWLMEYVWPRVNLTPHHPSDPKKISMIMILMEFMMTNGGGPLEYQTAVRATVTETLLRSLNGDPGGFYLTRNGLVLGDPMRQKNATDTQQTANRPPSEEGDLYMGTIPPTGNSDEES